MWNYHQEHCVEFLRDTLELGNVFLEEEILEAVYIMYTNSVNMELGPGKGSITGMMYTCTHVHTVHMYKVYIHYRLLSLVCQHEP